VDTSTGNIKVTGNLVIRGKVNSGFIVEAGGYINVTGVVDSATLTAGKDINLQSGANGSTINCGGNLKTRFIENCNVFATAISARLIHTANVGAKNLKAEGSCQGSRRLCVVSQGWNAVPSARRPASKRGWRSASIRSLLTASVT
jgi:uncharacterized protein (DUF342 family)